MRTLLGILASSLLCGCATRPDPFTAHAPPADFALAATILPGIPRDDEAAKVLPAWLVLEGDGTLRAALGERRPQSPLPGVVRTLPREDAHELWSMGIASGVLARTPAGAAPVSDEAAFLARPVTPGILIAWSAQGRRRAWYFPASEQGRPFRRARGFAAQMLSCAGLEP